MLVLLVGMTVGLVFLLGGLTGAATRLHTGRRSLRIQRSGVTVDAEVLSRRGSDDRRSAYAVTGQWRWGQANYTGEFTIPMRWWEDLGGMSIPIRIDPNRPQVAEILDGDGNPTLTLALGVAFIVMAVIGLVFLASSLTVACDQAVYELLEPLCEPFRGAS